MSASGHRLRAWGEACDACIAGRTLRCARIGGGAMGVIGPIGPMWPIGGAAKQRVGARWWRCVAAWGSEVVALRWQRMGSMVVALLARLQEAM